MKTVSEFQAVIFDLDGVLANTEPGIFRIHQELLQMRYQQIMDPEDYHHLFGLDYYDSALFLIHKYTLPAAPENLAEELHQSVVQGVSRVVDPIPDAQDFVYSLAQRGIRLGLASNSPSDYVRSVIDALGLTAFFPAPVCRDDVKQGKPAADPYLEACRRAGCAPETCLAVEDSPVGLKAALSAGMECALVGKITLPVPIPANAHHFVRIGALQAALLG